MRENLGLIIGGIVALILQVALAPNVAILGAQPNFILVFIVAASLFNRGDAVTVLAFVLGLASDALSTHPFGLMAGILLLATFVSSRAFALLDNDSPIVPVVVSMVCAALVECAYAVAYVLLGADLGFGEAVVSRALPCALYDCAMTLILIPLLYRGVSGRKGGGSGTALHVSSGSTTISNVR